MTNLEHSAAERTPSHGAQVLERLRAEIVRGMLKPGAALSEQRLAEELGVSRTPVREALIKLAEDGLVRIVPQSGTFVAPVDLESVLDCQLIREALECATVFLAARNATDAAVADLRASVARQRDLVAAGEFQEFVREDDHLHERLINLSGRPGVLRAVRGAKMHLDRLRFLTIEDWPHTRASIEQHEGIVDRVAARDGRGARKCMREHMRLVYEKIDIISWSRDGIVTSLEPVRMRRAAATE